MKVVVNKSNYYSSLTLEFTPSCTIKSFSPFINKTLEPAQKLKYDSRNKECGNKECGVLEDE